MQRFKKLSKWLLFIFLVPFLLLLIGVVLAFVFEKDVKKYLVGSISQNLNCEVSTSEIKLSLIKKFPLASLEFNNILIKDAFPEKRKNEDTLLFAEKLFLQFNLVDIFNENYTIRRISMANGNIKLKFDKKGEHNFNVLKADSVKSQSAYKIQLEKVDLDNVRFSYTDLKENISLKNTFNSAILAGNFTEKEFELALFADIFSHHLKIDQSTVLENRKIKLDGSVYINNETKKYQFRETKLNIEQLKFLVSGFITQQEKALKMQLVFDGKELDLSSFISLLPNESAKKLKKYELDGNIYFNASLNGVLAEKINPSFNANFGIENGIVNVTDIDSKLMNLFLKGNIAVGDISNFSNSVLKIDTISFKTKTGPVFGNFSVKNFAKPHIVVNANADLNLKDILAFLPEGRVESLEGSSKIKLLFDGSFANTEQLSVNDFKNAKTDGFIQLNEANIKFKNSPVALENLNGELLFDNNNLSIKNLKGIIGKSDFEIKGEFLQILSFFFIENSKLIVKGNFKSDKIILDDLVNNTSNSSQDSTSAMAYLVNPKVDYYLQSNINYLKINSFEATDISGYFISKNNQILCENFKMKTSDGQFELLGKADANNLDEVLITCDATLKNADIQKLFNSFNNFGQNTLTAKNLKGKVSAETQVVLVLDKNLNPDSKQLFVQTDIEILNGELNNFEPLKALSKFVKVSELENVKFGKLSNRIEIKDETIFIPQMDIQSSAMNLRLSGKHQFSQNIDYSFKILLRELLANKAKKNKVENSEFGEIEQEVNRGEGLALFIRMFGHIDNLKFTYDRKGVKESFQQKIETEKSTIKSLLKQEFGAFKNDTTLKNYEEPQNQRKIDVEWSEMELEKKKEEEKRLSAMQQKLKEEEEKKKKEKGKFGKFLDKVVKEGLEEEKEK